MKRQRNPVLPGAAVGLLFGIASAVVLAPACGGKDMAESTRASAQALSTNAGDVLGFEVAADWHVTSSPALALTSSTTHSQGSHSVSVNAVNYVSVQSATISVGSAIAGPVSYDLLIPPNGNASWGGATQLFVDCHSKSIFNQYVGQVSLAGLPTGQFTTIELPLPGAIASGLAHGCADLDFTIVLNVPSTATGAFLLDNLQLDGPPTVVACGTTAPGTTDAGVVGAGVAFQSTLVRPDVGTFGFSETIAGGDPTRETYSFTLNGSPLYQVDQQSSSSGTTTRTDTYFAPITGVHQVASTTSGSTITMVVDGRQTVPMSTSAPPSSVTFVDGQPAPQLIIPAAIGDAIEDLVQQASAVLPTCASGAPTPPSSFALAAAVATDNGHPSGDSGSGCTTCEVACDLGEGACIAGAIAGSIGCGPFAFVCAPALGAGCVGAFTGCQGLCHRSGTDCCPVDCGGGSGFTTPIGLCCLSGESCLKRGSSGHVALCCSSGQTACGGTECCGSDTTCMPTETGSSACCKPSQVNPQGICCSGGIGTNGQCCLLGSCTTDADCSTTLGACVNGCCTLG